MNANVPPTPSPRFSFKGYSFTAWLAKNASYVKTFVAAEAAAVSAKQWEVCGLLALAMGVKYLADAIDYWLTSNPS